MRKWIKYSLGGVCLLIFVLSIVLSVNFYRMNEEQNEVFVHGPVVVVAARPLLRGEVLAKDKVTTLIVSKIGPEGELVFESSATPIHPPPETSFIFERDLAIFLDLVITKPIPKGEPLTIADFEKIKRRD